MKYRVRVTVIDKKLFPELQERYCADPHAGPCPCYGIGDEFLFEPDGDQFRLCGMNTLAVTLGDPGKTAGGPNMPHCAKAWDAISRLIYTALQGGSPGKGRMRRENTAIACCPDGTRPVIFRIERLDLEETRAFEGARSGDRAVSDDSARAEHGRDDGSRDLQRLR